MMPGHLFWLLVLVPDHIRKLWHPYSAEVDAVVRWVILFHSVPHVEVYTSVMIPDRPAEQPLRHPTGLILPTPS